MKSLEIVNEEIEMRKGNILNDAEWNRLKKLEIIKQDLEVLEIIRKKVDFRFMGTCLQVSGENNTKWTFIKEFNLSKEKEEFEKLKQWLEENENERD